MARGNAACPRDGGKSARAPGSPPRLMNPKTSKRQSRFGIEDSTTALRISSTVPERILGPAFLYADGSTPVLLLAGAERFLPTDHAKEGLLDGCRSALVMRAVRRNE